MNAVFFRKIAVKKIQEIQKEGKIPVVVGGSGLYLKFISHDFSDIPPQQKETQEYLNSLSLEELAHLFSKLDPNGAKTSDLKNRRHLQRSVEICLLTKSPASEIKKQWGNANTSSLYGILLNRENEDLNSRIEKRTKWILKNGAIEEVRKANHYSESYAQAIGFQSIQSYLQKKIDLEQCQQEIITQTKKYAKRQKTWFKKEQWLLHKNAKNLEQIITIAKKILS